MGESDTEADDTFSDTSEGESLSDYPPLPPLLLSQLEAAREKAWQTFQDARTRSQKFDTAWAYFQLANSLESRWPQAKAIFTKYFYVLADWLDAPWFSPAGTTSVTREEHDLRWRDPPEFLEFERIRGLANAPALPDPAPSSRDALPVSLPPDPCSSTSTYATLAGAESYYLPHRHPPSSPLQPRLQPYPP